MISICAMLNIIKIFLQIVIFCNTQTVASLQYLHVKYCITQYLVKKPEMQIKFKNKNDVLIFLYKQDTLFLARLYELFSVACWSFV